MAERNQSWNVLYIVPVSSVRKIMQIETKKEHSKMSKCVPNIVSKATVRKTKLKIQ